MYCASQLVRPIIQIGRRKREPGANPGLPRSGERERKPSEALDEGVWEATAGRRVICAHESEDLPLVRAPPVRVAPEPLGWAWARPRAARVRSGASACSRGESL